MDRDACLASVSEAASRPDLSAASTRGDRIRSWWSFSPSSRAGGRDTQRGSARSTDPSCGGRLRLIAPIEEATVMQRILDHLGLPTAVARPACASAPVPRPLASRRRRRSVRALLIGATSVGTPEVRPLAGRTRVSRDPSGRHRHHRRGIWAARRPREPAAAQGLIRPRRLTPETPLISPIVLDTPDNRLTTDKAAMLPAGQPSPPPARLQPPAHPA